MLYTQNKTPSYLYTTYTIILSNIIFLRLQLEISKTVVSTRYFNKQLRSLQYLFSIYSGNFSVPTCQLTYPIYIYIYMYIYYWSLFLFNTPIQSFKPHNLPIYLYNTLINRTSTVPIVNISLKGSVHYHPERIQGKYVCR